MDTSPPVNNASFIRSTIDGWARGAYIHGKYRNVILAVFALRRLTNQICDAPVLQECLLPRGPRSHHRLFEHRTCANRLLR